MVRTIQTTEAGRTKQTARTGTQGAPKSARVKQVAKKAQGIATGGIATGGVKKSVIVATADKKTKKVEQDRAAKHRSVAYRKIAKQAGYLGGSGISVDGAGGRDALICLLSPHDAKRLIFYNPNTGSDQEKARREEVLSVLAPPKALRHAQVRLDAMLRNIMNEAVLRTVESGNLRVSAHAIHAAIRPYMGRGLFSQGQLPPKVVVKTMLKNGEIAAVNNHAPTNGPLPEAKATA